MRVLIVALTVLGLTASPAAGQDRPLPDLFSDTIDVRVVNVEAVVTDRDGNRVHGLSASDFELLVDGEPAPIDYFTEIDDGVVRASPEGKAADGDLHAVPSLEPDEPVSTNYLLFIDEFFAIRRPRDRVLKRLERDLEHLGVHDRMAVVAFDGQNVAQLTGDWTGERGELRDALREARERKALGLMRRADIDPATRPSPGGLSGLASSFLDGIEGASTLGGVQRAGVALNLTKRERQIQRSVLAATATLRSFADPPGRKAMLVLADGWGVPQHYGETSPLAPPPSIESIYGPLVHAANRVGYTLYPVDLAGLNPRFPNSPFGIGDASAGYSAGGGRSPSAQPSPFVEPQGLNLEWTQDAAFGYLAHETGGRPMINALRDVALADTVADTRSYYWLGFTPPRDQDDEIHDIEVRLAGRTDLRVRSRQSYLDLSKSAELTMMVEGSVLFGGAPGKESLTVRFGAPQPTRGRKILVPMEIGIPLDDVELLPMAGRFTNELELRVTVINEAGERSDTPTAKIRISGATEPPPEAVFVYETTLLLRSHEHRYAASVYDPLSGAVLSASGTVGPR